MVKKATGNLLGAWAFLIGVILAAVIGAFALSITQGLAVTLVILGLIVGLLNIGDKETTPFLLAAVALVIVSAFGSDKLAIIPVVGRILDALLILFVPATVIVALKEVFGLARV
jgi:hypothetical protein